MNILELSMAPQGNDRMFYVLVAFGAYFIGSFPSGYLIGRARGIDLRKEGSGNIGATNALRVLGKKAGYICFLLDFLKGALAVCLARFAAAPEFQLDPILAAIIAAACAMLGHTFPVWLGFRGGKGISTSGGIAISLFPPLVFLLATVTWIVVFLAFRIVSIASLTATAVLGISLVVLWRMGRADFAIAAVGVAMCVLAFWLHRSNIVRLVNGAEPRFEKRKKS